MMVVVVAVMAVVAVRVSIAPRSRSRSPRLCLGAPVDAVLAAAVRAAGRAGAAVRLLRRVPGCRPALVALGVARRAERLALELREGQGAAAATARGGGSPRRRTPGARRRCPRRGAHGAREGAGRPRANDPRWRRRAREVCQTTLLAADAGGRRTRARPPSPADAARDREDADRGEGGERRRPRRDARASPPGGEAGRGSDARDRVWKGAEKKNHARQVQNASASSGDDRPCSSSAGRQVDDCCSVAASVKSARRHQAANTFESMTSARRLAAYARRSVRGAPRRSPRLAPLTPLPPRASDPSRERLRPALPVEPRVRQRRDDGGVLQPLFVRVRVRVRVRPSPSPSARASSVRHLAHAPNGRLAASSL